MKKILLIVWVFCFAISGYTAEIKSIKGSLSKNYPDLALAELRETPIKNIFEATLGNMVFYTDGQYVIFGHIFSPEKINLTQARLDEINSKKIDSLDLSQALKLGSGKHSVIEFTDVDCPYCRQSEEFFRNADVTRYIFFMPLEQLHPQAKAKTEHILCSKDPQGEYLKIISGINPPKLETCEKGKDLVIKHKNYATDLEINGTPAFYINGKRIDGADPIIMELIK